MSTKPPPPGSEMSFEAEKTKTGIPETLEEAIVLLLDLDRRLRETTARLLQAERQIQALKQHPQTPPRSPSNPSNRDATSISQPAISKSTASSYSSLPTVNIPSQRPTQKTTPDTKATHVMQPFNPQAMRQTPSSSQHINLSGQSSLEATLSGMLSEEDAASLRNAPTHDPRHTPGSNLEALSEATIVAGMKALEDAGLLDEEDSLDVEHQLWEENEVTGARDEQSTLRNSYSNNPPPKAEQSNASPNNSPFFQPMSAGKPKLRPPTQPSDKKEE